MQMGYGLATVFTVVDDQPVAAFLDSQLVGYLGSLQQKVAEDLLVFRPGLGEARDRLFGHQQNVPGRLGIDVAQCEDQIVFIYDGRWNLAGRNFFKQGFHQF